eukprot:gene16917-biopygen771
MEKDGKYGKDGKKRENLRTLRLREGQDRGRRDDVDLDRWNALIPPLKCPDTEKKPLIHRNKTHFYSTSPECMRGGTTKPPPHLSVHCSLRWAVATCAARSKKCSLRRA